MMLTVFICEDDPKQCENLVKIVNDYVATKNYDIKIALATGDPTELLGYLEHFPQQGAIYILDVNLQHQINGITLATKIREQDVNGKIIFITTHIELAYLTFQYKVEAMDYIVKDSPEEIAAKLKTCLGIAYKRCQDSSSKQECFQVKVGDEIRNIPLEDIMFFESSHTPHKVVLHTVNSYIEFYGSLSDVEQANQHFYRCHQSYVVNTKNVSAINKTKREVQMTNGEIAFVAARKIKELQNRSSKFD